MRLYQLLSGRKGSVTDFLCELVTPEYATKHDLEKAKEEIMEMIRNARIPVQEKEKHEEPEVDLDLFDSFGF